jgi:hypothetical protein
MPELNFSYDAQRDVLTIEGNKFSGDFFRFFRQNNEGRAFMLERVNDGDIWIRVLEVFPVPENQPVN